MPDDLGQSNVTRANITGKVPEWAKPKMGRGGKGKRARLPAHRRQHARQMQKAGLISATAAKANGI